MRGDYLIRAEDLLRGSTLPDCCHACKRSDWWTHAVTGRRICCICHPPPYPHSARTTP